MMKKSTDSSNSLTKPLLLIVAYYEIATPTQSQTKVLSFKSKIISIVYIRQKV